MPVYSTRKVITEDSNSSKHTDAHLTFEVTPLDQIPKEYYKVAANLFQTIKDETKDKVGEGVADAAFNALFSKKTKEDIEKQTDRNAFVFIVPRKISFAIWGTTPQKYRDFADDVLRKAGFKKGKNDTLVTNTYYWYRFSSDKKHVYVAYYITPVGMLPASYQLQISVRCVEKNDHNAFVWEAARLTSNQIKYQRTKEDIIREQSAQEIANKKALGSIFDRAKEDEIEFDSLNIRKYIPNPDLEKTFVEFFDCRDQTTRRKLMAMTEAEHNSALTNLTSKLYDQIVKKTHSIDYGEIPKTKGDISKLSNYEDLMDTLGIIKGIVKEYKQNTKPIDDISVAIGNLSGRKDMFERAFRYDCELPMLMYNNLVMAVIAGTSFMITSL